MLSAAVVAHIWLIHAPQPPRTGPSMAPLRSPGTTAQLATSPARRVSDATSAPSVSLLVEDVIAYPVNIPAPVTQSASLDSRRERPIATAGLVAAVFGQPAADLRPPESIAPPAPSAEPTVTPAAAPDPLPSPAVTAAPLETLVRSSASTNAVPMALSRPGSRLGPTSGPDAKEEDAGKEEQVVRQILREYTRAFERLDARAAKAVWPSLDDRALQRAFEQLDAQKVQFASCGVSITGPAANARCLGNATYRPKVGSRVLRVTEREWTFNLARSEGGWQIVNATIH
jgi:hypothetical protein